MYKATRDFIKAREKFCPRNLVVPRKVEKLGTGEPFKCFENSRNFVAQKKAIGEKYDSLSGWERQQNAKHAQKIQSLHQKSIGL